MFRYVYIFAACLAAILLPIVGIFSTKLKSFSQTRNNSKRVRPTPIKYWIHAASLGEYEMALPIIQELLIHHKKEEILITIFSPSGYSQAIKGEYADRVMYLPLDRLGHVRQFYKDYAPQRAIFIRYDFWYNFIAEGHKCGTSFYLVNGRFTDNHFIFKWFGKPYFNLVQQFKGIFTSDQNSTKVLESHGIRAQFTGDTRFDRVNSIAQNAQRYEEIEAFINGRKVIILGSSWQEEEQLIAHLLKNKPENLAIIIAPHDLKRCDAIAQQLAEYYPRKYTDGNFSVHDNLLILDTMGMLSSMYQYADFSLIGGGYSGALHNILEPAVWGSCISFGPSVEKFPEAAQFIEAGFARAIDNQEEWSDEILRLIANEDELASLKNMAKQFAKANIGAASRVISHIL